MRKYWKTVAIFFLALAPRIYQLGFDVINIDASFWKENTYNFIGLFFQGRFGDMAITHHPGVILMWLGGMAMKIFRGVYYFTHGVTAPDTHLVYLWTHFAQKLPIALVTSLFVVFVYLSVKKLFDEKAAFLAAVLLALEPFFLAHSRVFHLDALLTVCMCSSVLMLLLYLQERNRRWLVFSGILGGLALLTKSTALFLVPFGFLVFFLDWFFSYRRDGACPVSTAIRPTLFWFLIVTITFVAVWPSMWVQPLNTLKLYFSGITTEATAVDPHITNPAHFAVSTHTIFGQQTYNPGWYYYPLVLAFRLSPVVFVFGLVEVFWGVWEFWKKRKLTSTFFLILYVLSFLILLSVPAKKLDRYILPILPFFCILAAYGLIKTFAWFKIKRYLVSAVIVFTAFTVFTLASLHPDYGLYFSPLFGGIKTGLKFDSDYWWGEGYKKAADYLNQKEGAENLIIGVLDDRSFKPFFDGVTHDLGAEYDGPEDYWIRSPEKEYEGFELEYIIRVGGYPLWGVFRNVERYENL